MAKSRNLRSLSHATKVAVTTTAFFAALVLLTGCGGGSGSGSSSQSTGGGSSPQNTQSITVNLGPANAYANGPFTSVTICAPGSTSCQTVSGILVDTGSVGLRVLSSALNAVALPQQKNAAGIPIVECLSFVDLTYVWGSVRTADVKMAGEAASSVPIQLIGDPAFTSVPASCSNGGTAGDNLQALQANGILGVGQYLQDCGSGCLSPTNPQYYQCPSSGCVETAEALSQQVQNPVALFPKDNNGVIVHLPAASAPTATLSGSLIFGIGTQSNNALGSATVFTMNQNGNFTTIYKSKSLTASFIDSGSNANYFPDSSITQCTTSKGFYCPATPLTNLSATNQGANAATNTVTFSVGNADQTFTANPNAAVFPSLAGTNPNALSFDWGLPFFYGRSVYTAIEGQSTPGGVGPYWAY
ncbi:MAG: DUF3443 domain-containing protein [Terriglobales bacterium]